jgi:hypothetical protein
MQCCTRQLISKIIRVPIIGQYNYYTNSNNIKSSVQEQHGEGLICSEWEETIIKEQRMPDVPFDLMQKNTIDQVHNNNHDHENRNKGQSNLNTINQTSN